MKIRQIVLSLAACIVLLAATFVSPALAQKRGKATDFAGVWETTIPDVNARYKITLSVNGSRVTGYFTNPDAPQYNGNLTGSVDPSRDGTPGGGRLDFVYLQPDVGARGGGYFIVSDQGTMAGFVQSEGSSENFVWEGKRIASGQEGATRGKASDFTGTWDTVVPDVNAHYKLVLVVDGDAVTGGFVNFEDGQYNGTLVGTVNPGLDGTPSGGRLDYTYKQRNGGSGGGYFIVASDGTMAGFTHTNEDSSTKYVWEGKRITRAMSPEVGQVLIPATTEGGGVRITADVTGYDQAGGGPDKCYLAEGDTANLLGSDPGDPTWKHLQGDDVCDGDDFWIYDDGKLANL